MKKFIGIFAFLILVYVSLLAADPGARSMRNHFNLARWIGLYGILSLGAGMLIISGGIDLSMGSVVGLSATVFAMILRGESEMGRLVYRLVGAGHETSLGLCAIAVVLLMGILIGLINGLLVTKVRVQAFVVTLCGLFVYRGAANWLANEQVKGLETKFELTWKVWLYRSTVVFGLPMSFVLFFVLVVLAGVFLHFSVYGRYFYAIGSNERAARYSGIATDRYKILAYVICSTMAAFYGILLLLQENSAQPSSTGQFMELYAIAGAVLGGCSLRGGEGSVVGIVIGATILVLLPNLVNMWGIKSSLEFTVIGGALLLGAILDEVLRRFGAGRAGK